VIGLKRFPDHHPYTEADVRELESMAPGVLLLTTGKDAVRLAPFVTQPDNWCVAVVRMSIEGGWDAFIAHALPGILTQKKGAAEGPLLERDASNV